MPRFEKGDLVRHTRNSRIPEDAIGVVLGYEEGHEPFVVKVRYYEFPNPPGYDYWLSREESIEKVER